MGSRHLATHAVYSYVAHSAFMCFVSSQALWSSGDSFWLQIQRPGFDSQRYQIFREVMGLERGTLNLVSTIEEVLERKNSDGHRDPSH
jgi:hypothetical protein